MNSYDLSNEQRRTYSIVLPAQGEVWSKTIKMPKELFYDSGHQFHRVYDGVNVFLMPVPGPLYHDNELIGYVELSWLPMDGKPPVAF